MPDPSAGEPRPRFLLTLVIGGVAVIVALTVIGWVIGTILSILRLVVVVGVAVAVIWAIGSARGER